MSDEIRKAPETINQLGAGLNSLADSIHVSINQVIENRDNFLQALETLRLNLIRSLDEAVGEVNKNSDEMVSRLSKLIS